MDPDVRSSIVVGRRPVLLKAVGLLLACVPVSGCTRRLPPPVTSPDGSMVLLTDIEHSRKDPVTYLCVVFEIRDASGHVLHAENTGASDRMRWDLSWVSNDRIRLRSSDIGTYYWQRQPDGRWKKEER
jgi:hypothetical protein